MTLEEMKEMRKEDGTPKYPYLADIYGVRHEMEMEIHNHTIKHDSARDGDFPDYGLEHLYYETVHKLKGDPVPQWNPADRLSWWYRLGDLLEGPHQKIVFATLAELSDPYSLSVLFSTIKDIAAYAGCSVLMTRKALDALGNLGLVSEYTYRGHSKQFYLNATKIMEQIRIQGRMTNPD